MIYKRTNNPRILRRPFRKRFGRVATRADARAAMFDCIESFYNRSRRHYSLGCSQTSNAYLAQIAALVGLTLATFDTVIPSSHLIA